MAWILHEEVEGYTAHPLHVIKSLTAKKFLRVVKRRMPVRKAGKYVKVIQYFVVLTAAGKRALEATAKPCRDCQDYLTTIPGGVCVACHETQCTQDEIDREMFESGEDFYL